MMLEQHAQSFLTAGWYRDPDDPKGHRYWNGEVWLSTGELAFAGEAT